MDIVYDYLGYASPLLLLIPLVLLVRLLVRRSRWSVFRVTLVSVTGVAIVSVWLTFAQVFLGPDYEGLLGGSLGLRLYSLLGNVTGGSKLMAFGIATALLFIWTGFALMDAIIASARFFINKPYIKEIVKEKNTFRIVHPARKLLITLTLAHFCGFWFRSAHLTL